MDISTLLNIFSAKCGSKNQSSNDFGLCLKSLNSLNASKLECICSARRFLDIHFLGSSIHGGQQIDDTDGQYLAHFPCSPVYQPRFLIIQLKMFRTLLYNLESTLKCMC